MGKASEVTGASRKNIPFSLFRFAGYAEQGGNFRKKEGRGKRMRKASEITGASRKNIPFSLLRFAGYAGKREGSLGGGGGKREEKGEGWVPGGKIFLQRGAWEGRREGGKRKEDGESIGNYKCLEEKYSFFAGRKESGNWKGREGNGR
jgi:hypothetical protein